MALNNVANALIKCLFFNCSTFHLLLLIPYSFYSLTSTPSLSHTAYSLLLYFITPRKNEQP